MYKRLEGWKARALSQARRTILIQIVDSTIPLYYMSVFLLQNLLTVILKGASKTSGGVLTKLAATFTPRLGTRSANQRIWEVLDCGEWKILIVPWSRNWVGKR